MTAAAGGLPDHLLTLAGRLRLRQGARLVHPQRHAPGGFQHPAGGRLCCRLALVQVEELGDLLAAERAEPPVRRAAAVQAFDQCGKSWGDRLLAVGTQHQEPPRDGRGRKTSQCL